MVTNAVRSVQFHGRLTMAWQKPPLADILALMVSHLARLGPLLLIKWMRAHGTVEAAMADGVPREAWEGNGRADAVAKT